MTSGLLRRTLRVASHAVLTGRLHLVRTRPEIPFPYRAGQFLSVEVAPRKRRAYSFAGDPGADSVDLLVDVAPGGDGSRFVAGLSTGDSILAYGPQGGFVLPRPLESGTIAVGVDVGAAPIRAMAHESARRGEGGRLRTFLVWQELDPIAPGGDFDFPPPPASAPTHLRADPSGAWLGTVAATRPAAAFLCGEKKVLARVEEALRESGLPADRVATEVFY